MNDWKKRLIAYIQKLDSGLSFYEAKSAVLQELLVMEHDYSLVEKEDITTVQSIDVNTDKPNRSLSTDELIKLFRDLF